MVGDVVEVVNTGAFTPSWDGTTDWDKSWADWVAGSALPKNPTAPTE
jgi:hypothetical protein